MSWRGCRRALAGCAIAIVAFFVGTAVLIRWLKDPRRWNESLALGDVRTVWAGQEAWRGANGGYYEGNLSCLAFPVQCLPGYPPNAPTFLDESLARQVPAHGYVRAFVPGPRARGIDRRVSSRSSVETWTYTARPIVPGETGFRSFYVDQTGVVRATSDDRAANASDPPIE